MTRNIINLKLVTDVGDRMCWWQVWDVGDRLNTLRKSPTWRKCRKHNDSATKIWNQSPTSLSPFVVDSRCALFPRWYVFLNKNITKILRIVFFHQKYTIILYQWYCIIKKSWKKFKPPKATNAKCEKNNQEKSIEVN